MQNNDNDFLYSVKAEHVSGDSIDAVDSVRAPTGEDHGADSDPLHYLQNPSQNPCPFDAGNAGTGGSQSVTGYESFDYDTKSFCGTLVEDIIISLDIHSRDAESKFEIPCDCFCQYKIVIPFAC